MLARVLHIAVIVAPQERVRSEKHKVYTFHTKNDEPEILEN